MNKLDIFLITDNTAVLTLSVADDKNM